MNPLIRKRLLKLWDAYHQAETDYRITGYQDTSCLAISSRRLAEVTTRFSTKELLSVIPDWDFPLWLRNDEAMICEQKSIKRPDRSNLPTIVWDGQNIPTLEQSPK
ncbi:MAG: hypothetical protein V1685_04510 [Parcubacteria group bacterium]